MGLQVRRPFWGKLGSGLSVFWRGSDCVVGYAPDYFYWVFLMSSPFEGKGMIGENE